MEFMVLQKQFQENHMVVNAGKCHCFTIDNDDLSHKITLNDNEIAGSNEKNGTLCLILHLFLKRQAKKLSVLARTNQYLNPNQKILLLNLVVKSQFSYCLLKGMFTS